MTDGSGTDSRDPADIAGVVRRDGARWVRFASAHLAGAGRPEEIVVDVVAALARSAAGVTRPLDLPEVLGAIRKACALEEERERRRGRDGATPRGALHELRPTERDALLLKVVGGLDAADVAHAAGVDVAAAKERVARALLRLARAGAAPPPAGDELALRRRDVEVQLGDLVDGIAPDDLSDFVADDDVSRDLVHDAERAVDELRAVAAARAVDVPALVAAVERRLAEAPGMPAAPVEAAPAPSAGTEVASFAVVAGVAAGGDGDAGPAGDAGPTPAEAAQAAAPASPGAPAPETPPSTRADGVPPGGPAAPAPGSPAASTSRGWGPREWLVAAAVAVGGAIALAKMGDGKLGGRADHDAWSGRVSSVSSDHGGGGGLERCSPEGAACSPVESGDDVPAGSTLRTGGRTRAFVELRDGTRISIDRDTEVMLDGAFPRRARLAHGGLVVDVPRAGDTRARLDLPLGFAETASGKLTVETSQREALVEVVRGSARLVDRSERGVGVHAGEEARIVGEGPPEVYPTVTLGSRTRWSERTFGDEREDAAELAGLGELRAKRPGQDQERKGAVRIASHVTRVRIAGNVARTEIEEELSNGTDEVLEGIYRFPLPPDAQIERLALDVDGKLEEGAFVDRERAASIWRGAIVNAGGKKPVHEEIVWVPGPWRDPALLEWQRGGRFELRVYPIPKRGSRRVVLAYTQLLAPSGATRRYVYPLPLDPGGTVRVGRFSLDVQVRGQDPATQISTRGYALARQTLPEGAESFTLEAQDFVPAGDLSIELTPTGREPELAAWAYQPAPDEIPRGMPAPAGVALASTLAARPGTLATPPPSGAVDDGAAYAALSIRPRLPSAEDVTFRAVAIVVDASRSMFGERYRRAASLAERLARDLDPDDRVTVLACDSTCRTMPGGPVAAGSDAARAAAAFLAAVTPEGASDVAGAIRHAADALGDVPRGAARVVYVGDGTPTVGPVSAPLVRREVLAAVAAPGATVTAVAIGADADAAMLSTVASAGGGVVIPYVPGEGLGEVARSVLGAAYGTTLSEPEVVLPGGLVQVAPTRLPTIRRGGELMIFARMTSAVVEGTVLLRGTVAGRPFEQRYPVRVMATTSKGNAFVPRLWAAAQIAELEQLPDAASRARAVELSGRFHVGSRHTSLLVLESPAMFRAFGLSREERVPTWTGEADAEGTAADGELAVVGDEDVVAEPTEGVSTQSAKRESAAMPRPAAAKPSAAKKAAPMAMDFEGGASPAGASGFAPPPPAAAPMIGAASGALRDELAAPFTRPPSFPRPEQRRRMIPMRKVWDRVGRITVPPALPASVTVDAIAAAEREAAADELRRDAVKRLYTLLFLAGNLDRAADVAERWSTKGPLDPDALTARADVAAARGDRELAVRILGSVVDVRPGDHQAQWRLSRLHRWAGRAELGCRHSLAVAQIRTTDPKLLVEAVRCARDVGHADVADAMLGAVVDSVRRTAEALLAAPASDPSALSGDLRLEATWDGGDDLDLSLLTPDGSRASWLGAPTRAVITARDVTSTSREGLALRGAAPGEYVVEITRPGGHRGAVHGTISLTVAGERRTVPFAVDDVATRVALVRISTRSRLVPL